MCWPARTHLLAKQHVLDRFSAIDPALSGWSWHVNRDEVPLIELVSLEPEDASGGGGSGMMKRVVFVLTISRNSSIEVFLCMRSHLLLE